MVTCHCLPVNEADCLQQLNPPRNHPALHTTARSCVVYTETNNIHWGSSSKAAGWDLCRVLGHSHSNHRDRISTAINCLSDLPQLLVIAAGCEQPHTHTHAPNPIAPSPAAPWQQQQENTPSKSINNRVTHCATNNRLGQVRSGQIKSDQIRCAAAVPKHNRPTASRAGCAAVSTNAVQQKAHSSCDLPPAHSINHTPTRSQAAANSECLRPKML